MAGVRHLIAAVLLLCALATLQAAESVRLDNQRCIDGQKVDPSLASVTITVDGTQYVVRVASRDNATAIAKMDPVAALKAILAYNRDLADRVALPKR